MMEKWRDIPGFEGCYQVSTAGRVRSLDREVHVAGDANRKAFTREHKGRVLKPGPSKSGHLSVVLGLGNSKLVHQLVLLAFVGPYPKDHEILHKNHTPQDNRLSNLKYGTRSENMEMDYAKGGSRVRPIIGTPLDGSPGVYFFTKAAATRKFSKNDHGRSSSIGANLSGRTRHAYGHVWRYA